jgi:hypothetical protein
MEHKAVHSKQELEAIMIDDISKECPKEILTGRESRVEDVDDEVFVLVTTRP